MRVGGRSGILAAALAAAALPAQAGQNSERPTPALPADRSCVPLDSAAPAEAAAPPVLVDGLGYSGIEPDTADTGARRWFAQGVQLIWGFDEAEAIRAFKEAQRLDPRCALCAWGEAWARGPTINLQPRNEEHEAAAAAAERAAALAGKLTPRDAALVAAMRVRTGRAGKFDNKGYARAMAALAKRFAGEDAVLVIAADAAMIMASRKTPKEGSNAQHWLETVLRRNPDHSGAIHMYIHLTDWIERQHLAEPYADRLGRIAPGASHLVHMPSHTFYGVGRYGDAAAVNMAALAADQAYAARVRPPSSEYRTGLYAHNLHFAIEGALMRGDGKTALEAADHFRSRYPLDTDKKFRSASRSAPYYAYGLHADIARVMAMPEPRAEASLLRGMRHYARGEALVRKGDIAGVRAEAAAIARLRAGPEGRALGSRSAEGLIEIAQRVLEGRAAMAEGRFQVAAAAFRTAMVLQRNPDFGFDPPPFWYPVRRSLGAALLASGDPESARNQLVASLRHWPNDALALYALAQAERALGQGDAAARHLARARSGWASDIEAISLSRI